MIIVSIIWKFYFDKQIYMLIGDHNNDDKKINKETRVFPENIINPSDSVIIVTCQSWRYNLNKFKKFIVQWFYNRYNIKTEYKITHDCIYFRIGLMQVFLEKLRLE